MKIETEQSLILFITDHSQTCTRSLINLQNRFQNMLTNALSHERMTPINSVINLSEILVKKCFKKIEKHVSLSNVEARDLLSSQSMN